MDAQFRFACTKAASAQPSSHQAPLSYACSLFRSTQIRDVPRTLRESLSEPIDQCSGWIFLAPRSVAVRRKL